MGEQETITLEICGLRRTLDAARAGDEGVSLPLCGDVSLTNVSAGALATQLARREWDLLAGPAPRCLPLLHVLSTFLGRERYVPLHRSTHHDMTDPIMRVDGEGSPWILDGRDLEAVRDKRVVLVTDVIHDGGELEGAAELVEEAGGQVVGQAAVLVSPRAAETGDYILCDHLPR